MSDYQKAPQVAQLEAERSNAVAYGMTDRVAAIDKQLAGLGVKSKAAERRQAAAEESGEDEKKSPPKSRGSRPQQTVD